MACGDPSTGKSFTEEYHMTHPTSPHDDGLVEIELSKVLRELAATEQRSRNPADFRRAEGAKPGRRFTVETMTTDGMHRVVALRQEDRVPLAEEDRAVLRSTVTALLDLTDHQEGAARTEVILSAHGPRIAACFLEGGHQTP